MIPCNFTYIRPDNLSQLPQALARCQGQDAHFYAGGTEIISMARVGSISPQAVIDMKAIPECRFLGIKGNTLHIGAAVTLDEIARSGLFPLLSVTVARIADHTNQCRITIGGNVCGTIIYREAVLPLLLADAAVLIWREGTTVTEKLSARFARRLRLAPGEMLLGFTIPRAAAEMAYCHIKRTKADKMDYPLITLAALHNADELRLAFSGLCGFPFRDEKIEKIAADKHLTVPQRVEKILRVLPAPVLSDLRGSADYRTAVTGQMLARFITDWEDAYAR